MLNVRIDWYVVISFQAELHVKYFVLSTSILCLLSSATLHCYFVEFFIVAICHHLLHKMLSIDLMYLFFIYRFRRKKTKYLNLQQCSHCCCFSAVKINSCFEYLSFRNFTFFHFLIMFQSLSHNYYRSFIVLYLGSMYFINK